MRCTTPAPPDVIEEGEGVATLQKGGGIILQGTGSADLPAESAAVAVPGTGKGTEAGPRGGTMMVTADVSRPGVMTPQAAGDGSTAVLRTRLLKLLMVGTKLQGTNGMSQSARGGVSSVIGHNGSPPGNRGQQGADLGGGLTALGAEHRGKSKGGGITMRDNLQGLNGMSLTPQKGASTISRHNRLPPGKPRKQGVNPINPSRHPTALRGTGTGSTPYQEGVLLYVLLLVSQIIPLYTKAGPTNNFKNKVNSNLGSRSYCPLQNTLENRRRPLQ